MIAYAVCAHTSRQQDAKALSSELGAPIAMDDGSLGSLANHDAAWRLAAEQDADWCVVIEDDAIPIDGFRQRVTDAIANVPGPGAISFYTGTARPRPSSVLAALLNAERRGCAWLRAETALWGPALALPTEHVLPMLEHVSRVKDIYDRRLGSYLQSVGVPCYYTRPSMVDHRDGRSLLSKDTEPRHAHSVGIPVWNRRFSTI